MNNDEFVTLADNELLELDGGLVAFFVKFLEAAGIVDAVTDFGKGFVRGWNEAWK